jgi:hypothetical protein
MVWVDRSNRFVRSQSTDKKIGPPERAFIPIDDVTICYFGTKPSF